jgi:hypothetical protein
VVEFYKTAVTPTLIRKIVPTTPGDCKGNGHDRSHQAIAFHYGDLRRDRDLRFARSEVHSTKRHGGPASG